jgi:hypothetical protein
MPDKGHYQALNQGRVVSRFTEFNLVFGLRDDTPQEVIDVLLFMTRQDDKPPKSIPRHPLFESTLWRYMLCETGAEAYSNARIELTEHGRYLVSIRCNCENADGEIRKFIDWTTPYIQAERGGLLGYTREENSELITLLAYPNMTRMQSVFGSFVGTLA